MATTASNKTHGELSDIPEVKKKCSCRGQKIIRPNSSCPSFPKSLLWVPLHGDRFTFTARSLAGQEPGGDPKKELWPEAREVKPSIISTGFEFYFPMVSIWDPLEKLFWNLKAIHCTYFQGLKNKCPCSWYRWGWGNWRPKPERLPKLSQPLAWHTKRPAIYLNIVLLKELISHVPQCHVLCRRLCRTCVTSSQSATRSPKSLDHSFQQATYFWITLCMFQCIYIYTSRWHMAFGIQTNRPRISDDVFRMVQFDVLEASLDKHDHYLEAHLINLYFSKVGEAHVQTMSTIWGCPNGQY